MGMYSDRMLVRFGYSRDDSLGNVFDDEQSRKTRGIRYAEWAEFMVLWRNDQIQFYEQSVKFPSHFANF